MSLEEFMESDIYKDAGSVEYIGVDGMELNEDEYDLLDANVINYHKYPGGSLEIKLNVI